jgi:hypothetical protein
VTPRWLSGSATAGTTKPRWIIPHDSDRCLRSGNRRWTRETSRCTPRAGEREKRRGFALGRRIAQALQARENVTPMTGLRFELERFWKSGNGMMDAQRGEHPWIEVSPAESRDGGSRHTECAARAAQYQLVRGGGERSQGLRPVGGRDIVRHLTGPFDFVVARAGRGRIGALVWNSSHQEMRVGLPERRRSSSNPEDNEPKRRRAVR